LFPKRKLDVSKLGDVKLAGSFLVGSFGCVKLSMQGFLEI
jgi:hypothetical protein